MRASPHSGGGARYINRAWGVGSVPSGKLVGEVIQTTCSRFAVGDVVKVVVPGVKPKSYSMSRQGESEFDITYKFYPGGACSGYLHSLSVGDEIQCFGKGAKTRNAGTHVGIVAFGVGFGFFVAVLGGTPRHVSA